MISSPATGEETPRILEYIPLYQYKSNPDEALALLRQNLKELKIDESQVTVTVLPMQPDKIAAQGTAGAIAIVKTLMNNIDPPPKPPAPPPAKPQDLIDDFQVKYLQPTELWARLDEIMNNFLDFKRFDTGAINNVVYAREDGSVNRINFYIPTFETVERNFLERTQGYGGYKVFIRATNTEKPFIDLIGEFMSTIDQPVGDKRYEVVPIHYVEVKEIIKQLQAAGYTAIDTSINVDATLISAIREGISPVIYSAPKIGSETTRISTSFSSRGGREIGGDQFDILAFPTPTSTADIHSIVVYGSDEEINAVIAYVDLFDVPAKQILIEAQIIEIRVDDLTDIGLRKVSGKDDYMHTLVQPAFPGEGTGLSQEATSSFFTYDDTGERGVGEFQATIAALILEGKASIKARPKVTTVDGRQAIITIVRQVPVVHETIIQHQSRYEVSFVPVGITLNIKPRVGRDNSEIQMQINAVVSNVETINHVVAGLNIQAPELNTREVSTIVRVPNKQPLILGGLIQTQAEERTHKIPILGDIPILGKVFRRTREKQDRNEVIIVITPHIAEEVGGRTKEGVNQHLVDDKAMTPVDTTILDEPRGAVNPRKYYIKFEDIVGIDPITRNPISFEDDPPPIGSENDPVFLTVQRIVRKLDIVDNLNIVQGVYIPEDYEYEKTWQEKQILAEAFAIHYLININDLNLDKLRVGRVLTMISGSAIGTAAPGSTAQWEHDKIDVTYNFDPRLNRIRDSVRKSYTDGH